MTISDHNPEARGVVDGPNGERWTLDELDGLHNRVGLGAEWQRSERRAELYEKIGRRQDRLDALAYECARLAYIDVARRLLASVTADPDAKPRRIGFFEAVGLTPRSQLGRMTWVAQ